MKKKLALMLAISMTVGAVLAGCGNSSGDAAPAAADAAKEAGADEDGTANNADNAGAAKEDGEAVDNAGAAEEGGEAADNAGTAEEGSEDVKEGKEAADTNLVYAVEAGSAGEAAAEENGFQTNVVASQADALMEVAAGTSDAAIIDLLMAGAMIGEGTSYPDMTYTTELTTEEYGVGCRKGSDLASFINSVFGESYADGTMEETATVYGVQEALVEQPACEFVESEEDSDVAYIKDKGTLVVGITEFEPMDYKDESGEWIGFDADMARAVAEKLGVEAQFVVIDWDNKIMELDSKNIDVVWNGMTLTSETMSAMECTNAYCNNAQVIVIPAE